MIRLEWPLTWQHNSRSKKKHFLCFIALSVALVQIFNISQVEYEDISRKLLDSSADSPRLVKPLKILALGGSITWGGKLADPSLSSYASLLGNIHFPGSVVHNEAIRATGASYFSLCIQSIIEGTANFVSVQDSNKKKEDAEKEPYDVILLEFAVNGLDGSDILIRRLRQRYPGAIIIFIRLYSLVSKSEPFTMAVQNAIEETNTILYDFHPEGAHMNKVSVDSFTKSLFSIDFHHLAENGHFHVSKKIRNIILEHLPERSKTRDQGTWGNGDTCYFWGKNGIAHPDLQMSGGSMKRLDQNKISYEFFEKAYFNYSLPETVALSANNGAIPVYLTHMTSGNPSIYPKLRVVLNDHEQQQLDPLYPQFAKNHVSKSTPIGATKAGVNTLILESVEKDKETPFRLWGLSVCTACADFGNNLLQIDATYGLV